MAQLQKSNHRITRDKQPCLRCGDPEHPTWQHGKEQFEIYQTLRSRKLNPEDRLYDPTMPNLGRILRFDQNRNKLLIDGHRASQEA